MPEFTPRQLALYGLGLLALVVLAAWYLGHGDGATAAPVAGGAPTPAVPLNLNTATPEQLDELDGIGPATAEQIVKYREAHGGFGSVDELDQVPGIGETRLASLREQVRVWWSARPQAAPGGADAGARGGTRRR